MGVGVRVSMCGCSDLLRGDAQDKLRGDGCPFFNRLCSTASMPYYYGVAIGLLWLRDVPGFDKHRASAFAHGIEFISERTTPGASGTQTMRPCSPLARIP